jgi:hypothetical protein
MNSEDNIKKQFPLFSWLAFICGLVFLSTFLYVYFLGVSVIEMPKHLVRNFVLIPLLLMAIFTAIGYYKKESSSAPKIIYNFNKTILIGVAGLLVPLLFFIAFVLILPGGSF